MLQTILVAGGVLLAAVLLFRLFLRSQHHNHIPREYSTAKFIDSPVDHGECEIHRDGYTKKKVPADLDAIVIGSGIGSLMCAGLLARVGKRVVVLEQHYIAGGSTHAFEEKGFEFDTGIHYIGNVHKRQKYFDLVTDEPLEWDQMGKEDGRMVYDEIRYGSHGFDMRAGVENLIEDLVKEFPKERAAIEEYVRLCHEWSQKDLFFNLKIAEPAWLARLINPFVSKRFFAMVQRDATQVINGLTQDKRLRAVLLGQFGDYCLTPSRGSFFNHAGVANHYFNGGFYPRGGSAEIAKKIIPVIERAGGRVLVRRAVEQILFDTNGNACGVQMAGRDGDQILASIVVSGAGAFNTFKKLLPPPVVPRTVLDKLDAVGPSCSFVYLFVGMEGTPEELRLRSSNIWHWPADDGDLDYDAMIERFRKDPHHAPIPMFIGFPCAKDSTWNTRFPGKANAVILTMADYDWFAKWEDKKQGKRGVDYDEFKKLFEKRILEEGLYHYYPQTRGKVVHTDVGSPVTFNYYIGSRRGEVYGLDCSAAGRYVSDDWLRPKTQIPGVYLTGQDVTTSGVTGALMAGVLTAHSVLGYGGVLDILSGRNLVEDLWHLDAKQGKSKTM